EANELLLLIVAHHLSEPTPSLHEHSTRFLTTRQSAPIPRAGISLVHSCRATSVTQRSSTRRTVGKVPMITCSDSDSTVTIAFDHQISSKKVMYTLRRSFG